MAGSGATQPIGGLPEPVGIGVKQMTKAVPQSPPSAGRPGPMPVSRPGGRGGMGAGSGATFEAPSKLRDKRDRVND